MCHGHRPPIAGDPQRHAHPFHLHQPARPRVDLKIADLTHPFGVAMPVADSPPPFREDTAESASTGVRNQRWTFVEHAGTHVDAPSHLFPELADAAQLRAEDLVAPLAVLRLAVSRDDAEPALDVEALSHHETIHGRIPARAAVFLDTGWDTRFTNPTRFMNVGADGRRRGPGFSAESVAWLIAERDIACIGIDTLSLDIGSSTDLPAHRELLGNGRYGVECLRGLSAVPPSGATVFVGLVPWENGSGGPCRVLAHW
jgi:kynurenine formamidase